ncbi:S8 family serine peptidase [Massilia cavernae]|uniref:Subtilisin n=1 Tax=Massilia cavernae TaxID=2320864 RepID=A0A418XR94_9BURK|nr:S8 family serine peptidase [Massilia cavernae]RJG15025.1 subtilisin [Massilia cavernae]
MPKNPDGGQGSPHDINPAPDDAAPQSQPGPAGRPIHERKKQFLIAPRHPEGLQAMGLAPLSMSAVEQALRASDDIDIVDTVGARNVVGAFAAGAGGGQGVLVARMTDQKAGVLMQQGQGQLLVERDQYLNLMEPAFRQPVMVSNILPTAGPALVASVIVVSKDGTPLADAEVSLFGSMLPASGVTDVGGQATLTLYGETPSSIRGLYVKPKADFWSFYQRDPDISIDEPNVVVMRMLSEWPSLAGFPHTKLFGWGQKAMRLDQLPANYRGQGIRIAVIDSGAATSHEGLSRIRAGFDIINKRTNPNTWSDDTMGHGSHCSGVIGAADLAHGMRGFAPDAEIHACKLFPGGQVSQLIDALEYCIEHQIDVVNLSLGGAEPSEALEQQIVRAKRAGIACIVAAGNSGGPVQYPASSPNVLAVAAIGKLDEFPPDSYHAETLTQGVDANGYFPAKFSCFGPQVAVCGPGVAIASTVPPNNYAAWDGTSMAAPHITGLAALVLAHHSDFQGAFRMRSAERVEHLFQLLKMSARRVSLGDQFQTGVGLPDALIAVGLQPQAVQPGQGQAIMPQQLMGQIGGIGNFGGIGSARRGGSLELFGMDPAMAAYASLASAYPQQLMQRFGQMPGMPFGIGTPGYRNGW